MFVKRTHFRYFELSLEEKTGLGGILTNDIVPDITGYKSGDGRERLEVRLSAEGELRPDLSIPFNSPATKRAMSFLDRVSVKILQKLCIYYCIHSLSLLFISRHHF